MKPCKEPKEEILIDFAGPICIEKDDKEFFFACIDRFSKFSTAVVFTTLMPKVSKNFYKITIERRSAAHSL